jgi:hypothetical protein
MVEREDEIERLRAALTAAEARADQAEAEARYYDNLEDTALAAQEPNNIASEEPGTVHTLHQWLRRRLRAFVWKQWRHGRNRFEQLTRRGVPRRLAAQTAGSAHGPWRIDASPVSVPIVSSPEVPSENSPV